MYSHHCLRVCWCRNSEKISGSGASGSVSKTSIISNEGIKDIMKIVDSLVDSGLLIKDVN